MKLRRWGVWATADTIPPETGHTECVARCFTKRGAVHLYHWYTEHQPYRHFHVSGPR